MALRLTIAAVGHMKGAEQELYRTYIDRLSWPVTTLEVADRQAMRTGKRQSGARDRLLSAVPSGATIVVLDESGRSFDSRAFAAQIKAFETDGVRDLAFLVGGADGHSDDVRAAAKLLLSFGKQTWPHMLARVMLAEQLYRASTILSGHPYHRD